MSEKGDSHAEESTEDEVRIVLPSSNNKGSFKVHHGIVISGEASESDEEIDTEHGLQPSASDCSISEKWESPSESTEKDAYKDHMYRDSLLHRKLREKNQVLRKNFVELVTQPYDSASKEIHTISQQLIKSQMLVQDLRNTIQRLTSDLFDMEDKMAAMRSGDFLSAHRESSISK